MNAELIQKLLRNQRHLSLNQAELGRRLDDLLTALGDLIIAVTPGPAVRLGFSYSDERNRPMPKNLADDQKIVVTLNADDLAQRHGAKLDGAPTWSVDDPATGSVVPAADGMSAELSIVPGSQAASFNWTATTSSGNGARTLTATDQIIVVAGDATSLGFSYGDPQPASAAPAQTAT